MWDSHWKTPAPIVYKSNLSQITIQKNRMVANKKKRESQNVKIHNSISYLNQYSRTTTKPTYIERLDRFREVINQKISIQNVISIDLQTLGDDKDISIILISYNDKKSKENINYVIDILKVFHGISSQGRFEFLRDFMGAKVFENPMIVKVVFGKKLLGNLERDYGINTINVKDIIQYWQTINKRTDLKPWGYFLDIHCQDRIQA